VAEAVTGNFRLEHADDKPRLRVQLRGGKPPAAELAARLQAQLARFASVELQLELLPYREFPHGFDHDFERKNQYL